jgi:molecular chaperone DnaK
MVRNQITENINISIDPMIAVAKGAALFASTKNIPDGIKEVDKSKVQLKLVCAADTVETEEKVGIQVLRAKTDGEIPEILFVELNRHDKGWGSGKVGIKNDAAILDVLLESGKPNGFSVSITDEKGTLYQSEPDSFSIIQGFKVAGATLPYDLCIDAYQISAGKQQLISLKGLMKNQPLPAKGLGVFLTQRDIRPGNKEDKIKIPVYYGEAGTNWNNNEMRGEIIITGEQLPGMLPKGSEVELSVEIDESEMIKVSATFPYLDDEIVDDVIKLGKLPALSIDSLNNRLNTANTTLDLMEEDYPDIDLIKVEAIRTDLNDISSLLESGGSDGDTKNQVFGRLCKCQKAIDTLKDIGEWPRVVGELNDALEGLKTNSEQFGNEKTSQIVDQLSNQVRTVIQSNDQQMAVQLTEQIRSISFAIVDQGAGVALEISMIKGFGDNFEMHDWKDRNQARSLINEAKAIINSNRPTKDNLRPIVSKLYGLLPSVQEGIGPIDKGILAK